jgi:hypothetical protein
MLIFHTDHNILMILLGEEVSSAGEHIRNGYPELLEDWEANRIRATKLDKFMPAKCLIMDAGKPRPMTDEEIKAHDAALASQTSEQAAATDLEAKIQAELRAMAIERLATKEV